MEGIVEAVRAAVADVVGTDPGAGSGTLAERLARLSDFVGGEVYLVLDQVDEYFLYHAVRAAGRCSTSCPRSSPSADAARERPARDPRGVARPPRRLRGRDPGAVREPSAARTARPRRRRARRSSGRSKAWRGLDRRRRGRDRAGRRRRDPGVGRRQRSGGNGNGAGPAAAIEPPYLQVVMERLWDAEREAGSTRPPRSPRSRRSAAARRIVSEHLDRALAGARPGRAGHGRAMFAHLVTPSGAKVALRGRRPRRLRRRRTSRRRGTSPTRSSTSGSCARSRAAGRRHPRRDLPRRARLCGRRVAARGTRRRGQLETERAESRRGTGGCSSSPSSPSSHLPR